MASDLRTNYGCLSVTKHFEGGSMDAWIYGEFQEDGYNPRCYYTDDAELTLEIDGLTFYRRVSCRWERAQHRFGNSSGYWADAWASDAEWETEDGERMTEAEYESVVKAIGSEAKWYHMELNLLTQLAHKAVAYVIVLDMENMGELVAKSTQEDDDE